jgi:hypothetical protein
MNQNNSTFKAVIQRLSHSHFLWHQCRSFYSDLDQFQIYLNACIQALRSVTFVLQKNKAILVNFDQWYERWRDFMKSDIIMNWLIEARNHIEKEGDLELNSKFIVAILANYSEQPFKVFMVSPTTKNDEILKVVQEQSIPKQIMETGIYKIERQCKGKGSGLNGLLPKQG